MIVARVETDDADKRLHICNNHVRTAMAMGYWVFWDCKCTQVCVVCGAPCDGKRLAPER